MNSGAGEHELHRSTCSTRQGLSNKTTSHDVDGVLKVSSPSLARKSQHIIFSAHFLV